MWVGCWKIKNKKQEQNQVWRQTDDGTEEGNQGSCSYAFSYLDHKPFSNTKSNFHCRRLNCISFIFPEWRRDHILVLFVLLYPSFSAFPHGSYFTKLLSRLVLSSTFSTLFCMSCFFWSVLAKTCNAVPTKPSWCQTERNNCLPYLTMDVSGLLSEDYIC